MTPRKTTLDLREARNDRYVGSIIAQKQVKTATIYNVLQKAWEGFSDFRNREATDRVVMFDFAVEETRENYFICLHG